MRFAIRAAAILVAWLACLPASAAFHLWTMSEVYSNADGSVQFLELTALTGGQQFMSGHRLEVVPASGQTRSFTFDRDLAGDTSGRRMLIGTQGFAALGVVAPDYVVPNGFFAQGGGTINFAESSDVWVHGALPAPPLSLNRDGSTATNSPRNFFNQTGSISSSGTPAPATFNVQALWWASPAGSEEGWGLNITHQGETLFATWFTYDLDGSGLWLSAALQKTDTNRYAGQLFLTSGAPFNSVPYDSSRKASTPVGTASVAFTQESLGTFSYTVNGITQSKAITRFLFASPQPTCTFGGSANGNYQDLWWRSPAGSEDGWGINIAHQGDILFVTWFTFGPDGTDMWMVMPDALKAGDRRYTGAIHRTSGSPFSAYDETRRSSVPVGSGTFQFTDDNNGTFTYTVDGLTQSKTITRFAFASPQTTCSFPP